jgi:hypothetical protein
VARVRRCLDRPRRHPRLRRLTALGTPLHDVAPGVRRRRHRRRFRRAARPGDGSVGWVRSVLEPWLTFLRALPLLALAALAPAAVATTAAVVAAPVGLTEAARAVGATRAQVIRDVVVPSALPETFTGIRLAVGMACSSASSRSGSPVLSSTVSFAPSNGAVPWRGKIFVCLPDVSERRPDDQEQQVARRGAARLQHQVNQVRLRRRHQHRVHRQGTRLRRAGVEPRRADCRRC